MLFNSLTFVLFLLIVLVLYGLVPTWRGRKLVLLGSSYVFYGAWNPPFVLLLALSTVVDWFMARGIAHGGPTKRIYLAVSLCVNLGLLGYFKYGTFLLETFTWLMAQAGITYTPPPLDIVLPVGISFYTFQTLSYTIDVYRGRMRPWDSFLDFALFVSFFPQLVAGPIVRAAQFLPQLAAALPRVSAELGWGLTLLVIGLFEKVILADAVLAPVVDQIYEHASEAGAVAAWVATIGFGAQVYFDFAGYSTCAVGLGLCLGFRLPDNFRYPFAAVGFSDFWQRWHISLSTWLRDYLYIPLGGSRRGYGRAQLNLLATMVLCGIWHGASWRMAIWGAIQGLHVMVDREIRRHYRGPSPLDHAWARVALGVLTFLLFSLSAIFFRAPDFATAIDLFAALAVPSGWLGLSAMDCALVGITVVGLLVVHQFMRERTVEGAWSSMPWWVRGTLIGGMLVMLALAPGEDRAFVYFQF